MIKNSLKCYFSNIWHIFTLLGVFVFGILLSLCIAWPIFNGFVNTLSTNISNTLKDFSIDAPKVIQLISNDVNALNWSDPIGALSTCLDKNWLIATIHNAIYTVSPELVDIIMPTIEEFVVLFLNDTKVVVTVIVAMWFVFGVLAYVITDILITIKTAKSINPIRLICCFAFETAIVLGILVATYYTYKYWNQGYVIVLAGAALLFAFLSLFTSWLVYGKGKVRLFKILNLKNIILILILDIVCGCISIGLFYVFKTFVNELFAFIMFVPLTEITLIIIERISVSYVSYMREKFINGEHRESIKEKFQDKKSQKKKEV